jgi:hypothetical protein
MTKPTPFYNFRNLDPASLALCEAAVSEAPPLPAEAIDTLSVLFGITPVEP